MLAVGGTIVDSPDRARLDTVLTGAGWELTPRAEGGFVVPATAQQVAQLALEAQVLVTEIRSAGSGGLEEMFLQLTADDARENAYENDAASARGAA